MYRHIHRYKCEHQYHCPYTTSGLFLKWETLLIFWYFLKLYNELKIAVKSTNFQMVFLPGSPAKNLCQRILSFSISWELAKKNCFKLSILQGMKENNSIFTNLPPHLNLRKKSGHLKEISIEPRWLVQFWGIKILVEHIVKCQGRRLYCINLLSREILLALKISIQNSNFFIEFLFVYQILIKLIQNFPSPRLVVISRLKSSVFPIKRMFLRVAFTLSLCTIFDGM